MMLEIIRNSLFATRPSLFLAFGHLPLNTYLSVVCIAAVATELGGSKYIHFCRFVSSKKCKLCIILCLLIL
jgi:hypothetical protein